MSNRWNILKNKQAIVWDVLQNDLHTDSIEMSGFVCSDIVKYGNNENGFVLFHHPIFPTLRCRPNNTAGSYQKDVPMERIPRLVVNENKSTELLKQVVIDGTLKIHTVDIDNSLDIEHRCFTSTDKRLSFEKITVYNNGAEAIKLSFDGKCGIVDQAMGPMGVNVLEIKTTFEDSIVEAGTEYSYFVIFSGHLANEGIDECDPEAELKKRLDKIDDLTSVMELDTGNDVLDTMFYFAKLRAGEAIFKTRSGLIHSPGGKRYYAAIWCNDEVEYAGPYFAYTGDKTLIEASMNAYRLYRPFMSTQYEPIPSSIVAEGLDFWNGKGDRGDAAMYLYGASHFALTVGDKELARELLSGIEWCAEYCRRKINADGIIESNTDELEERFPSGDANLCTSVLAFDGYRTAAILERYFENDQLASSYDKLSSELETAIDKYFSRNIHGFDSYRYYDGCEVLRSWICLPLCMGIFSHVEGTVNALTSEYLLTSEGILTTEENKTIWDRTTLYALRGIFASGYADLAMDILMKYCNSRLLGEQVPYAVEVAGVYDKRQLSGESALFCKIVLEGMLNIQPKGLNEFSIEPQLPYSIDHLYLKGIHAFGGVFDIIAEKGEYKVISSAGEILAQAANGEKSIVQFSM